MKKKKLKILSVILAGLWITISEFVRNEFLLKSYWTDHYNQLGLKFETLPINGVLWMVWSFVFAFFMYKLLKKFSLKETLCISWIGIFVLMWISSFNLQTLPLKLLYFAIPLSVLEVFVAGFIIQKTLGKKISFKKP